MTDANARPPAPIAATRATTAPVAPRQRPLLGRVLLWLFGVVILSVVLLLPYRARIYAADAIGRAMNAVYHLFVRLVRWFLGKLES